MNIPFIKNFIYKAYFISWYTSIIIDFNQFRTQYQYMLCYSKSNNDRFSSPLNWHHLSYIQSINCSIMINLIPLLDIIIAFVYHSRGLCCYEANLSSSDRLFIQFSYNLQRYNKCHS